MLVLITRSQGLEVYSFDSSESPEASLLAMVVRDNIKLVKTVEELYAGSTQEIRGLAITGHAGILKLVTEQC